MLVVDFKDAHADKKFTESLRDTGFVVLKNHGIPFMTFMNIQEKWKSFFYDSKKHLFPFDSKHQDGYVSTAHSEKAKGSNVRDIKEFYHYYSWGRCPHDLKSITRDLYSNLQEIAFTLLQWIQDNLPPNVSMSETLTEMIKKSPNTLLRIIHYPPLEGNVGDAVRAAEHTDICLLTLLPAISSKGLQIKKKMNGSMHLVTRILLL